jgi:hypothetical protein
MSNTIYCPDGVSRWFYERASGSYKVMIERDGKTLAGIKKLKELTPTSRRITKTDLAKFLFAWDQRPDIVSLGGQKNFIAFMGVIEKKEQNGQGYDIDATEYKIIIAKVILFKSAQTLIRPRFPAYQANIVAYTISVLSKLIGNKLDFGIIWKNQCISENLGKQIIMLADQVNKGLHSSSNGTMISEWAKKKECWDVLSNLQYDGLDFSQTLEYFS